MSITEILAWADAHDAATGSWPTYRSGGVHGVSNEDWGRINSSLGKGLRGLPRGQTLTRLLAEHRGVRNVYPSRPLNVEQILAWADAHHAATGCWPNVLTGPVVQAPGETWRAINHALTTGGRGLAGGSSIRHLLRANDRPPKLTVEQVLAWAEDLTLDQILAWADAHHAALGCWPRLDSGRVLAAHGERWSGIATALDMGRRGLKGGMSLAGLLATHRSVPF